MFLLVKSFFGSKFVPLLYIWDVISVSTKRLIIWTDRPSDKCLKMWNFQSAMWF